jgi:hypothetical protein
LIFGVLIEVYYERERERERERDEKPTIDEWSGREWVILISKKKKKKKG